MKSHLIERWTRKVYRRNRAILNHREGIVDREELKEYYEEQEAVNPAHPDNKEV